MSKPEGASQKNRHFDAAAEMLAPYLTVEEGRPAALWAGGYDTGINAQLQGHTTVETTPAGRVLAGLELYKDPKAVTPLWSSLSNQFVNQLPQETPVHFFMRTGDGRGELYQYDRPALAGVRHENLRWHPMVGVEAKSLQEVRPSMFLGDSLDGYATEEEARRNLQSYYSAHPTVQREVETDLLP